MNQGNSRLARCLHSFTFRLVALTALAGLAPVCILLLLTTIFADRFQRDITQAIDHGQEEQWQRSRVILGQMAEDSLRYKALDVALQLELYLQGHRKSTVADLGNDPAFHDIAIQPVGRSGYTSLIDAATGRNRFHPQYGSADIAPQAARGCLEECRKIIEASVGGKYAGGYYSYAESDGRTAKKYMYIAPLRETTADGVRFAVVASTYLEEFTRSIESAKEVSDGSSRLLQVIIEQQLQSLKQQGLWYLGAAIVVILLIAGAIGVYFSRLIRQLRDATERVKRGEYDLRLPMLMSGEIGALLDDFRTMATNLESATIRREELERIVAERIAEAGKLQEKLREAQKLEAIGALAGGVAHDLNNILSSIITLPELMLLNLPEDNHMHRPLTLMRRSGLQAAAIVQDLLTMARRGVMLSEVLDLNDIARQQLQSPEFSQIDLRHPGVRLFSRLDDAALHVRGSRQHLSNVVINLLNNALETMVSGGEITIACAGTRLDAPHHGFELIPPGEYATLAVHDQGSGIAAEDLPHIFEPFYTKRKMGRSGTGLGMAIVWSTVKDHHGYIDATSTPGRGSSFTVYLPATGEAIDSPEELLPVDHYRGDMQLVLVVDDSDNQRMIAEQSLIRLNYRVASVASGEAALRYLRETAVALVILDMLMPPGIDGLETYQRIVALGLRPALVIASGFSESDRVRSLQELSGGIYLKKPYTLQQLGLAVHRALAVRTTSREESVHDTNLHLEKDDHG